MYTRSNLWHAPPGPLPCSWQPRHRVRARLTRNHHQRLCQAQRARQVQLAAEADAEAQHAVRVERLPVCQQRAAVLDEERGRQVQVQLPAERAGPAHLPQVQHLRAWTCACARGGSSSVAASKVAAEACVRTVAGQLAAVRTRCTGRQEAQRTRYALPSLQLLLQPVTSSNLNSRLKQTSSQRKAKK